MSNYIQPLILPPIFLAVGFPFFKVTNELNEPAADMQSRQQTAQWVEIRDGNSSENFTPRGIEESRNGNLTFLGDRGRQNLFLGILEEFRGAIGALSISRRNHYAVCI